MAGGGEIERTGQLPLTQFVIALHKMTPAQRLRADPAKAAARYGIREDWAAWWIGEAIKAGEVWPVRSKA